MSEFFQFMSEFWLLMSEFSIFMSESSNSMSEFKKIPKSRQKRKEGRFHLLNSLVMLGSLNRSG